MDLRMAGKDLGIKPKTSTGPLAGPVLGCELSERMAPWVSSRGLTSIICHPKEVAWVISLMSSSSALRNWELPDTQQKTCQVTTARDYAVPLSSLSGGWENLE